MWPVDAPSLMARQRELAEACPEPWRPPSEVLCIGACWVSFPRGLSGPGGEHDPAWAAAVAMVDGAVVDRHVTTGVAGAAYTPGLLALRAGPLMEAAARGLATRPDALLVDATGRDHPRGAGLALHLGAELDLPTVGITHRPLLARGDWPADSAGATSPLRLGGQTVACWMRTRAGVRPLVVHPGWRVDLATAVAVVASASGGCRTPEPLRRARHLARQARSAPSRPGP